MTVPASVLQAFGNLAHGLTASGNCGAWQDCALPVLVPPGFSGARVWRWDLGSHQVCLHCHPPDVTLARLKSLAVVASKWASAGIPVPQPWPATDGQIGVVADDELWTAEEWRPGVASYQREPSNAKLRSACQAIARLHDVSATIRNDDWCPRTGRPERLALRRMRWANFAEDWGSFRPPHGAGGITAIACEWWDQAPCLARRIDSDIARASAASTVLLATLRDVWHDHVLFTGNEVTGLVDLGAADIDSPMADLSRLLGSFAGDLRDAWISGTAVYSEIRPLSEDDRMLLDLYDASSVLLSGTNWLVRWATGYSAVRNAMVTDDRIERRWGTLLARLKGRLAGFTTLD